MNAEAFIVLPLQELTDAMKLWQDKPGIAEVYAWVHSSSQRCAACLICEAVWDKHYTKFCLVKHTRFL